MKIELFEVEALFEGLHASQASSLTLVCLVLERKLIYLAIAFHLYTPAVEVGVLQSLFTQLTYCIHWLSFEPAFHFFRIVSCQGAPVVSKLWVSVSVA